MTTLPCVGPATLLYVSVSPSTSVAVTLPVTGVSSFVLLLESLATGASFTAVTVSVTVFVAESAVPSLALKVKLSEPL